MSRNTATLARSIIRASSTQSYYVARLLVDKDLLTDFYRAYAYFRWVDDVIDCAPLSDDERIAFIVRQRKLIDCLYLNDQPVGLISEEEIVADLIRHDRGKDSGLQSFIRNMLAVIEFDAYRKEQPITQEELISYSNHLAKSVTDGLQYFIGNGHPYPATGNRYQAAIAAHITHLLRDMLLDIDDGFVNIPREYLQANNIGPENVNSPAFRAWVHDRVTLARQYFREGKRYLDQLDVLRCKIAGYLYCARFEGVLDSIENDGYLLRPTYSRQRGLSARLKIARVSGSVALQHFLF